MNNYINLEFENSSRQKPEENIIEINRFQKLEKKINSLEETIDSLKQDKKVVFEDIIDDRNETEDLKIVYKTIPIIFLSIYLMISANFIGEMLPCYLRTNYFEDMLFKHVILILSIFFVSLYTNPDIFSLEMYKLVGFSFLFYSIFIFTTKCEEKIWFIATISLIFVSLMTILHDKINKKKNIEQNEKKFLKFINFNYIKAIFIIFILYSFGFLLYLSEKKYEYRNNFSYLKFFIGVHDCGKEHKGRIHKVVRNMALIDKIKLLKYLFN